MGAPALPVRAEGPRRYFEGPYKCMSFRSESDGNSVSPQLTQLRQQPQYSIHVSSHAST